MVNELRFWAKVDDRPTPLGCRLWLGAIDEYGYGAFRVGARVLKAHRVAWELEHGPVAPGLLLMHTCDQRNCVNVGHLRVGTKQLNGEDMYLKGRSGDTAPKLTKAQLEELRGAVLAGEPVPELARRFGVTRVRIYQLQDLLERRGFTVPRRRNRA